MFIEDFTYIGNYLWEKSIQNISVVLGEEESQKFTSNDYFYLTSICNMNGPTLSELAKKHGVTKPAISAIVRKLMKLGLVEKLQSVEDRRFYTVQLTTKGRSIILGDEKQYAIIEEWIKQIIADEQKYHEFEQIVSQLSARMKGEVVYEKE